MDLTEQLGAWPVADFGLLPPSGEGRLARVGRAQVDPVLGRRVVERTPASRGNIRDDPVDQRRPGRTCRRTRAFLGRPTGLWLGTQLRLNP